MTATKRCPECSGARILGHPAGMVIDHRNDCGIRGAEDATQDADAERAQRAALPGFYRSATATEIHVLRAWGADIDALGLVRVYFLTRSIRRREFEGVKVDHLPGIAIDDVSSDAETIEAAA